MVLFDCKMRSRKNIEKDWLECAALLNELKSTRELMAMDIVMNYKQVERIDQSITVLQCRCDTYKQVLGA